MNLEMDQLRPLFNGVLGTDFGPGTTHQICYTLGHYSRMLSRFCNNTFGFRANGPSQTTTFQVVYPGSPGGDHFGNNPSRTPPLDYGNFATFSQVIGDVISPDYASCPFADGMADPREDAEIVTTFSWDDPGLVVGVSLFNPRFAGSSWEDVSSNRADPAIGGVWLPFSLTAHNGSWQSNYTCTPSGATGFVDGGDVLHNYLGIDNLAGSVFGFTFDSRIALGDLWAGTAQTYAYFNDPGGANKVLITGITTLDGI